MIVRALCNSCLQPFEILVQDSDRHLIKEVMDEAGHTALCPRLCGGRINMVGDPVIHQMLLDRRLKDPVKITGKQLYQAINGMGLPDEIPHSVEVVEALLKATAIKETVTEVLNDKIYLHELKLANGVVIHLCGGMHGAQVLKVTRES